MDLIKLTSLSRGFILSEINLIGYFFHDCLQVRLSSRNSFQKHKADLISSCRIQCILLCLWEHGGKPPAHSRPCVHALCSWSHRCHAPRVTQVSCPLPHLGWGLNWGLQGSCPSGRDLLLPVGRHSYGRVCRWLPNIQQALTALNSS